MKKVLISALVCVWIFSSCLKGGNNSTMCTYSACGFVARTSEIQAVQDYLTSNSITATQHCSGMFYTIDIQGTGKMPDVCSTISVRYTGKLSNGTVFDQHSSPVSFNLTNLIPGWKNALPLINSGGKIHLYIPPSLGYGSQDVRDSNGTIVVPANSILIFDIDLTAVQ
jgi:FKBP-type peptidyl-prolyl cis-trans isomerase FkpA